MRDKIKRYQYVCRIVFSSFCFIAILVSITQSFGSVSAVEGSASTNASVTVSSACSFSRTNGSGEYNGILANNSSVEIIGSTFTTFCNDPGGYAVYATGYSNNEYGNTDLIYNNEPTSANNIKTNGDTTESGNSNNGSSWKMKLVPVENNFTPTIENSYNNFGNIPSTYTKVASYNNVTINNADSTTGSSITTHYQATASSTQPAGTYAGTVKYTMVHPGTTSAAYFMQDIADWKAELPNPGDTFQAVDRRDGKVYWVARLADGNIWMTQNLDLDIDETKTYTHYDTDLGWNDPNSLDLTATWQPAEGHSTIPWDAVANKFSGWGNNQSNIPYSADPGEKYYYTSNGTGLDITFNSISQCLGANHTRSDCEHYHAGNYYNWTAAVATNNSTSIVSSDAPNSICPAGWRLPKISNNEFANLLVAYNVIPDLSSTSYVVNEENIKIGFNTIRASPLYFVRSGYINNGGTLEEVAYAGGYYSSSVPSSDSRLTPYLRFDNSTANPKYSYFSFRYPGRSLRCLARTED